MTDLHARTGCRAAHGSPRATVLSARHHQIVGVDDSCKVDRQLDRSRGCDQQNRDDRRAAGSRNSAQQRLVDRTNEGRRERRRVAEHRRVSAARHSAPTRPKAARRCRRALVRRSHRGRRSARSWSRPGAPDSRPRNSVASPDQPMPDSTSVTDEPTTTAPRPLATARNSATSDVLPIPATPRTNATVRRPPTARSSARSRVSCSDLRPTSSTPRRC